MATLRTLIRQAGKQLTRLRRNLEQVATTGEPEAVHDVRVCCRRLNEPLGLLASELDDRQAHAAQRQLRRLRRYFQKLRDLDVLQAMLGPGRAAATLAPAELARLEGLVAGRRERALQKARRKVQQRSTLKSLRNIERLFDGYRQETDAAQESIDEPLARYLGQRAAELRESSPQAGDEDLHQARINLKRFRYTVELVNRLEGHEQPELMSQMTRGQDLLGEWNDFLIAAGWVARRARKRRDLIETSWLSMLLALAAGFLREAHARREQIVAAWPSLMSAVESTPTLQPAESDVASPT